MAKLINLRQARKRADKQRVEKHAAENRFAYGRPKSERNVEVARRAKAQRDLDSHRNNTTGEADEIAGH